MSMLTKLNAQRSGFADRVHDLSRSTKIVAWIVIAVFFYALPLLNIPVLTTPDTDFAGVLFTVAIYCLVALGLNIVVGYAGLLDLGYVGFYAVGAYTVGVLTTFHAHWPFLLAIPAAVLVAMVSGVLLGAPTLRVRGDYLAIVTLGFGEIIRLVIVNVDWLGGAKGISGIPSPPDVPSDAQEHPLFEIPHIVWESGQPLIDLDTKTKILNFGVLDVIPFYWFALTVIILVIIADVLIKNSRVGRAWEATREDEDAAELMGVPTFRYKLLAFAMGAAIGGLSGALFATRQGFISPQSFGLLLSILFLAAVVVGGGGNRWGVMVGAFLVVYIPERLRSVPFWPDDLGDPSEFRVLLFGIALMLLAIYRPQGILPATRSRRARKMEREIDALEEGDLDEEGGAGNA